MLIPAKVQGGIISQAAACFGPMLRLVRRGLLESPIIDRSWFNHAPRAQRFDAGNSWLAPHPDAPPELQLVEGGAEGS